MSANGTKRLIGATLASGMLFTGASWATMVNPDGGGASHDEPDLQEVLDGITVGGSSSINVFDESQQTSPDEYWQASPNGSTTQLIVEITSADDTHTFGIFDPADPTNRVELFAGTDGPGHKANIQVEDDGDIFVDDLNKENPPAATFSGNVFGYYLDTFSTWYSDVSLNGDGADHMVAYEGGQGDQITINGQTGPFAANEYLLAWEDGADSDGDAKPGDWDYQDFVALAESVAPVPLPASVWLLGSALVMLAGISRRARRIGLST